MRIPVSVLVSAVVVPFALVAAGAAVVVAAGVVTSATDVSVAAAALELSVVKISVNESEKSLVLAPTELPVAEATAELAGWVTVSEERATPAPEHEDS